MSPTPPLPHASAAHQSPALASAKQPKLPILDLPFVRMRGLQLLRITLLLLLACGLHAAHQHRLADALRVPFSRQIASQMLPWYGEQTVLAENLDRDRWWVLDDSGAKTGYILQTSPQGDSAIGFSGPTNLLLAFDTSDRLIRLQLQSSRDTRDHVALIAQSNAYWEQWIGKTPSEIASKPQYDSVAGATLTSRAIAQSIQRRLGNKIQLGQFSTPISMEQATALFGTVQRIEQAEDVPSLWRVFDSNDEEIGWLLRTSPAADHVAGYQGPTDVIVGVATDGKIVGIQIGASFDNEPYVGYVRQDRWFRSVWEKQRWPTIASTDLQEAGIEGVSGATMTSMAVATSIIETARHVLEEMESQNRIREQADWKRFVLQDLQRNWATLALVAAVLGIVLVRSRLNRRLHVWILAFSIVYLGLVKGHLLSIGMWGGWVQHGVPWASSFTFFAISLVALCCAAFLNKNVYCSHLCAYGAVQQCLPRAYKWQRPYSSGLRILLRALRPALLVIAWAVLRFGLPVELADLEPFDAFVWEVMSVPSLAIAFFGLLLSWKIPMGYCQHACMTGSLLDYLRPVRHRDRFGSHDLFLCLLLVATFLPF